MPKLRVYLIIAAITTSWGIAPDAYAQHSHQGGGTPEIGDYSGEPCDLSPDEVLKLDVMKPGEKCTPNVTGQFWYKICTPGTSQTEWHCCWVYDPVKCCNVMKRYPVTTTSEPKEYLVCVRMTVNAAAIKNLPKCNCSDVPVPYQSATNCPVHKLDPNVISRAMVAGGAKYLNSPPGKSVSSKLAKASTETE